MAGHRQALDRPQVAGEPGREERLDTSVPPLQASGNHEPIHGGVLLSSIIALWYNTIGKVSFVSQ